MEDVNARGGTRQRPEGLPEPLRRWADEREREVQRAAEERRTEHFAVTDSIPDLEFLTPLCSVCGLPTEYDEGFYCDGCSITWPRNGYGHEAVRDA